MKGRTFHIIYDALTNALGYTVYHKVIDARSVVPQHRERIFFVGFKERRSFEFPQFPAEGPKLETILEAEVPEKYTLSYMKGGVLLTILKIRFQILTTSMRFFFCNHQTLNCNQLHKYSRQNWAWANGEVFVNLFSRLDPLAAGKRSDKVLLTLKKAIESSFGVFEREMKDHNIVLKVIGT